MTPGIARTDGLYLRAAAQEDIPALSTLSAAARARYAGWPDLAFVATAPPLGPDRFAAGETLVARLEDDPTPLGFVLLRPLDGLLYLDNISVASNAGGRGIGTLLLAAAEARRLALGLPGISLTTFRAPPWNGPWFRRQGFAPMPRDAIGAGLADVIARQNRMLDPASREVLWRSSSDKGHKG